MWNDIKRKIKCFVFGHNKVTYYKDLSRPELGITRIDCWECNRVLWKK